MRIAQGCFSFLPDLDDRQSAAQVEYMPERASVVLAAMLERFTEIRAPGGYLRSLSAKAEAGAFSCGPMIMALMRQAAYGSQL